jgi:hypothetical protein
MISARIPNPLVLAYIGVTSPETAMTYLLFFFSGLSGLISQVVWVRTFGNVFGNTIPHGAIRRPGDL